MIVRSARTRLVCKTIVPFTGDNSRGFVAIRRTTLTAAQDLSDVIVLTGDGGDGRVIGAIVGIEISSAQVSKENFHRLGSLERELGVGTILSKLSWQAAKDETTKHASMSWGARITLAVCEAPRGEIVRSIIRSEVAVATCQGHCITENSATDRVSCEENKLRLR